MCTICMNCLYKMTDFNESSHFLLRKSYLLNSSEEVISDVFFYHNKRKLGDLMLRFSNLLSPSLNIDIVAFNSPLALFRVDCFHNDVKTVLLSRNLHLNYPTQTRTLSELQIVRQRSERFEAPKK